MQLDVAFTDLFSLVKFNAFINILKSKMCRIQPIMDLSPLTDEKQASHRLPILPDALQKIWNSLTSQTFKRLPEI